MTGPRPDLWKSGPDPIEHAKYRNWLQQRNQAQFRKETWLIDFETWKQIWGDQWPLKGRGPDNLCMTRIDPTGPWSRENAMLISRRNHTLRQDQWREPNWRRGPRKKRRKSQELQ